MAWCCDSRRSGWWTPRPRGRYRIVGFLGLIFVAIPTWLGLLEIL
jgi:hypothetical protein